MPSYCCSSSDFLQSPYTVLLSNFFCLFRAPPDVVVLFLVFLRSFRFKSFLSLFSPFVTQIKNFCNDPGFFFLLMMYAKYLTDCFSLFGVEGGDHGIHVCIFIIHDGEDAHFLPTIAWNSHCLRLKCNVSSSTLTQIFNKDKLMGTLLSLFFPQ